MYRKLSWPLFALLGISCTLPNTAADANAARDVSVVGDVNRVNPDVLAIDVQNADVALTDVVRADVNEDAGIEGLDVEQDDVIVPDVIVPDVIVPDVIVPDVVELPANIRVPQGLLGLWAHQENVGANAVDESSLRPGVNFAAAEGGAVIAGAFEGPFRSRENTKHNTICEGRGTIELWVEANAPNGPLFDIGLEGDEGFESIQRLERAGDATLRMNGPLSSTTFGAPNDALQHIVVVMDGVETRFIIDGEESSITLFNPRTTCPGQIVTRLGNASTRIRLLALYRRPLSVDEVRQNMEYGSRLVRRSALADLRFPIDVASETMSDEENQFSLTLTNRILQSAGSLLTTSIRYDGALPTPDFSACEAADEITMEAWLTPDVLVANGPDRIFQSADSIDVSEQNFVFGQGPEDSSTAYTARISNDSDLSAIAAWRTEDNVVQTELTHLVFVHSSPNQRAQFFINGQIVPTFFTPNNGNPDIEEFAAYQFDSRSFQLGRSSENFSRNFNGELHDVAIHCAALDDNTVLLHYLAGPGATR